LYTSCCPFMFLEWWILISAVIKKSKVKWSGYRHGVSQRVGTGIALLFHDHGTRRGWVVSSTPWPHFPPGKTRYPFYRRLGGPHRDSIPDRPVHSQLLYWLSYPAHNIVVFIIHHVMSLALWIVAKCKVVLGRFLYTHSFLTWLRSAKI